MTKKTPSLVATVAPYLFNESKKVQKYGIFQKIILFQESSVFGLPETYGVSENNFENISELMSFLVKMWYNVFVGGRNTFGWSIGGKSLL